MATHSSILAWRIPGTVGPGGLPSMGSYRVGHDWSELAAAVSAATYMFSLEKSLFSSLAHFLIGSFIFLELSCRSCLHMFEINSLSVASFAIIFSHSEGCLFTLLSVFFVVHGSASDYQADEQAGVARLSWRLPSTWAGRFRAAQFSIIK